MGRGGSIDLKTCTAYILELPSNCKDLNQALFSA